MTLDVAEPMTERGELPNLARLVRDGCCGPLATESPVLSWPLWVTVATGQPRGTHKIDSLWYHRLFGVRVRRRVTDAVNRAGLKGVLRALMRAGLLRKQLYRREDTASKTLWEIVNEHGGTAGVVGWANTWPSGRINGFLVPSMVQAWRGEFTGDEKRQNDHLVYPAELMEEIRPLILSPEDVPLSEYRRYVNMPEQELLRRVQSPFRKRDVCSELRYVIASDQTIWRVFQYGLERFRGLNLAMVLFWAMDTLQHAALRYSPFVHDDSNVSAEERSWFGDAVAAEYRFIDRVLGDIMARMTPDDSLVALSDHGFAYALHRRIYDHKWGTPPGVLYLYGGKVRRGVRVEGATLYDVAPTVLRLCGCPPVQGMPGRCLDELLTS